MFSLGEVAVHRRFVSFVRFLAYFVLLGGMILPPQSTAYAAAILTVTPITWNVVGLDSNSVTVGPNNFPVGVRVCNTGDLTATGISADFVWDTSDPYIDLRSGSLDPITLASLASGACSDFYFEVTITRNAAAYDHTRRYHIQVTAANDGSGGTISVSSPMPREIYVEHLVSQNRNSVTDITLDGVSIPAGGTMNLNTGQTYTIQLIGATATNGYEQLESFINFPNTIFQINSVSSTYSANAGTDANAATKLYADACGWVNDPTDVITPAYRECTGTGKYGGNITITYQVTIIATSASSGTINTLIYDFSGSSYHYNSDFSTSSRIYNIIDPNACAQSTIAAWNFENPDGTSTAASTDNAVGTPTITAVTLSAAGSVAGNGGGAARSHSAWSTGASVVTTVDYLQFAASTEGYYNIMFSFDALRSAQGPQLFGVYYANSVAPDPDLESTQTISTSFQTFTRDVSGDADLDNNAGAAFRLYGYNAGSSSGTARVDNVTITGCKLPASFSLAKSGTPTFFTAAGQPITYAYTLTNTGQVSLQSPYTITDSKGADMTISCAGATSPLTPGAFTTCSGTFVTTAADVTAGLVTNTATVAATTVIGDPVMSNQATETVEFAGLSVLKQVSTSASGPWSDSVTVNVGDTVFFQITVDNTGNADLGGITVDDGMAACTLAGPSGDADADNILDAAEVWIYGCSITAVGGTNITNTVTASSTDPTPLTVTDTASYTAPQADLLLTKTDGVTSVNAGGTTAYIVRVTNNGPSSVSGAILNDPAVTGLLKTAVTCSGTPGQCVTAPTIAPLESGALVLPALANGEFYEITVTVTVTANSGSVTNTATATTPLGTADPIPGNNTASDTNIVNPIADLEITKTDGVTNVNAGGATTYTIRVTNNGPSNVSLAILSDPVAAGLSKTGVACSATPGQCIAPPTVAELESGTFALPDLANGNFYEIVVTANVSATSGSVTNVATVTAPVGTDDPNKLNNLDRDVDTVDNPSFIIAKDADVFDVDTAGDIISYTVMLTNTGNVILTGVTVSDPLLANLDCDGVAGAPFTTTGLTIAVNGTLICTGTYTVTQADMDTNGGGDGLINNTVTADTAETPAQTASTIVEIIQLPSMLLTKTANPTNVTVAGDIVTYTFSVQNTGNVTLTNITITDTLLSGLSCTAIASLAPGATQAFTCAGNTHTVTQIDLDNNGGGDGDIDNSATAAGTTPSGGTTSDDDSEAVALPATNPGLTLTKTANPTSATVAGDVITYMFSVLNTGNVTLTNITLTDTLLSGLNCTSIASLAPNASQLFVCTGNTYTVAQADLDNNGGGDSDIDNTATATGTAPGGGTTMDNDSAAVTLLMSNPSLVLTKTANPASVTAVGDTVSYGFSVQNTGNVTLANITITDTLLSGLNCTPIATLPPSASQSFSCTGDTYRITQADFDNNGGGDGDIDNTATATGTPPSGPDVSDNDSEAVTLPVQNPDLTILKALLSNADEDNSGTVSLNDTLTYTVTVTNTGNTTLTNVVMRDTLIAPNTTTCTTLAPNATCVLTGIYVVTLADVSSGQINNTGSVTDTDVCPNAGAAACEDTNTISVTQNPALNIVKEVATAAAGPWNDVSVSVNVGDTVYYRIRVLNTGNITLTNLVVTDSVTTCSAVRGADITGDNDASFEAGEEWVYTCSITAALGTYQNIATADTNETAPDTDTAYYTGSTVLIADPALSKTANPTQAALGETVTFTLTVTNAGNAPAPNVVVIDVLPAIFDITAVNLSGSPLFGTSVNVTPAIGVGPAPYTVVVTLGSNLDVNDVLTIDIVTTVNSLGTPPINNTASVSTSAASDIPTNNSQRVSITLRSSDLTSSGANRPAVLPATGFAPGVETKLPAQPQDMLYAATDVLLEIPGLGVKIPIVGVPKKNGSWDVSWLGKQAGWLEGSAFPSWSGNSVLTSHVYEANGLPGSFVNLNKLKYGDQIIVHAYGQKYIFQVQTNQVVAPNDTSSFKHEERSWLTLITCKEYDERTNTYRKRVVVRAVLVKVLWDK